MSADLEELARRAVKCPRWRWVEGMGAVNASLRGVYASKSRVVGKAAAKQVPGNLVPDLTDPATMGCLLALVREAWGPTFHLIPQGGWLVQGARLPDGGTINLGICATSEAEALVAALEAAP